jgi:hypothetical protein
MSADQQDEKGQWARHGFWICRLDVIFGERRDLIAKRLAVTE